MRDLVGRIPPLGAGLAFTALAALYAALFLHAESEIEVLVLLIVAVALALAGGRSGFSGLIAKAAGTRPGSMNAAAVLAVLVPVILFHNDHFPVLMVTTVLLYMIAALGLNIQFGYAGVLNFAGAAFFGVGAYSAAALGAHTPLPPLLILFCGGAISALIGCVLIFPVLRTRGHYSAVVTIAFAILFKTFLEVNDALGGPQGLAVAPMSLLGWNFNDTPTWFGADASFYLSYALLALLLASLVFAFTRRVERSWLGLAFDAVRLDETASACFGIGIVRAKVLAFVIGNFIVGIAGALYAMMQGFIAPSSFGFSDSLILVAIVLLGGMGSPWGTALAAAVVVVLPEKLQVIQEYRFLLFAVLVMAILLFRPEGLLPRAIRNYSPGWRPKL